MESADRSEWELYGKNIRGEIRQAGERVGRFSIVELVSISLFGCLYHATDRNSGEAACLHFFPSPLTRDPGTREAIAGIAGRLEAVRSQAVLVPREVLELDGQMIIVHDGFAGAGTLTRYFEEASPGKGLAVEQVKTLLRQVAHAVEAAYEAGVHHFSLIPENILIDQDGMIKVHGFGFMAAINRREFEVFVSSAIVPIKRDSRFPGYSSLEIMSPELRNKEDFDTRADVYALGMLAYYLITHLRPVSSGGPLLAKADGELPDGWGPLIKRCLRADPRERYPGAQAFLAALDRVENHASEAEPRQKPGRRKHRMKRPPWAGREKPPRNLPRRYLRPALLCLAALLAMAAGWRFFLGSNDGRPPEPAAESTVASGTGGVSDEKPDLQFAKLRLRGTAGARVDAVGANGQRVYLDVIPASGEWVAHNRLLPGVYDLAVSKEGHVAKTLSAVTLVAGKWTELEAHLAPVPTTLHIISEPAGANVSIGGEIVGKTPLLYEAVAPGSTVTVRIGGEGVRPMERVVEIEPGRTNVLDFGDVEAARVRVALEVLLDGRPPTPEELADVTVAWDGEAAKSAAFLERALPLGDHAVEVSHPDYYSESLAFEVNDRAMERRINLLPRPARLNLILPDRPTRLFIDDKLVRAEENTLELPPGETVEVVVSVKDFIPVRRTFHQQPNSVESWEPELWPLPPPDPGDDWKIPYLDVAMAWVGNGEFVMGSPRTEQLRLPNEGPSTRMRLTRGFWVGVLEVTQSFYRRVSDGNPSRFRNDAFPVDSVSWHEAMRFCEQLTEDERQAGRLPDGYVYRLPTEAEWEYFARAGTRTPFSFGDSAMADDGNFRGRYPRVYESAKVAAPDRYGPMAAGSFEPNPWGLYDVHGNVREWVYDGYNDRLPGGEQTDFVRLEGRGRTYRGGGWEDAAHRARSSARDQLAPDSRRHSLGFRIVLAPPVKEG